MLCRLLWSSFFAPLAAGGLGDDGAGRGSEVDVEAGQERADSPTPRRVRRTCGTGIGVFSETTGTNESPPGEILR